MCSAQCGCNRRCSGSIPFELNNCKTQQTAIWPVWAREQQPVDHAITIPGGIGWSRSNSLVALSADQSLGTDIFNMPFLQGRGPSLPTCQDGWHTWDFAVACFGTRGRCWPKLSQAVFTWLSCAPQKSTTGCHLPGRSSKIRLHPL